MTPMDTTDEERRAFLLQLAAATESDPGRQASMYALGEALGLDRDQSQRLVEDLSGDGFVEIRSLSGGVGLTPEGVIAAADATAGGEPGGGQGLSGEPVLTDSDRDRVGAILVHLKTQAGELSWNFDLLTDLMADIKTIDAQLQSNRPKFAIICECFRSIQGILDLAGVSPDAAVMCLLTEDTARS